MQYGNNTNKFTKWKKKQQFKSYYVVWKLFGFLTINLKSAVFKSYYVVWKPGSEWYYFVCLYLFKSYYVVWKPGRLTPLYFPSMGLNRTMQYGNMEKRRTVVRLTFAFKSYYVVWKPQAPHAPSPGSPCLNRTMQYGNLDEVFKMCFPCHV